MRSPDHLRAEVSRLVDQIQRTKEVSLRQSLAARAMELAQEAEAIASFSNDPEGLRLKIAHYRHMLDRTESEPKQKWLHGCCETPRTSCNRSAANSAHQDRDGL